MVQSFPGGRKIIRQTFVRKGTPVGVLEPMLASFSDSTIVPSSSKCGGSSLRKGFDGLLPPNRVLDFLASCLPNGVLLYIKFISLYRRYLISTEEIGLHLLIRRFFKEVAFLKPQRPRYDFIWDSSSIIIFLAFLYPHKNLILELISRKSLYLLHLVTLFTSTTTQRMQTLACIQCA